MLATLLSSALSCTSEKTGQWHKYIKQAMEDFGITTKESKAMFLAQLAYESDFFTRNEESFNFTVKALKQNFSRNLSRYQCEMLGRNNEHEAQQKAIANLIYYKFNGNVSIDDGWKYKGRGFLPIRGKYSYLACGNCLNLDLIDHPDLLREPAHSVYSAAWLWKEKECNAYPHDVIRITHALTGGVYGLTDREEMYLRTLEMMA